METQARLATTETPLRRARRLANYTLAQLVREIDRRSPTPTGVTESLISAWELGKRRTSPRYRRLLCDIYGMSVEDLFADQDAPDAGLAIVAGAGRSAHGLRLITSFDELLAEMEEVVRSAHQYLVVTGSRSRDRAYLEEIERVLEERPRLVHYRLLFGPPHRQVLKDHLLRLLELRDPDSRDQGMKTLFLGMVEDPWEPERFFCASERRAVAALPSLTTAGNFDCGVVLVDPNDAQGLVQHGKQLYPAATKLESLAAVRDLAVLR